MDLSRIPAQPKPGLLNVLIEIPGGSKNKYEFDKDLNAFALDRVLFASVQYPLDYGFVPNTLADDGDPLDGMVMMDQPTFPGCVITARPIGMLEMIDGAIAMRKSSAFRLPIHATPKCSLSRTLRLTGSMRLPNSSAPTKI